MSIDVKESTIVHPAKETPKKSLWLSSIDLIRASPLAHLPLLYIYNPKNEDEINECSKCFDTRVLKESLSRVLVPFYPVAGRLKKNEENGRIEIDCNAAGALFVDAQVSQCLGNFGGFEPLSSELRKLVMPTCDYSSGLSAFPLLMVQVTRFKCRGVCICFAVHHHVADGIGHLYFINSWSRLARGLELDVQPFHDRVVYLAPRRPPQVKFQHLEYEPPSSPKGFSGEMATAKECVLKLLKDQINTLKLEATSHIEEQSYKLSMYEVLAAHVWRSACKARGLTDDQCVKLYIPTDGRSRWTDPILPQGYFGNVLFFTTCSAKAWDITSKPLWYAAGVVHDALKRVENMDYLRSAVDYLESQPDLTTCARGAQSVTCPNLSINSWGRLPLYEADFGCGKPNFVGRGGIRFEGEAYFVPNPNKDGSFSLNIKLFTIHMPLFEKYLYA